MPDRPDLTGWSPAPVTVSDDLPAAPVERLAALFDVPAPVGVVPPLWHWMYFLEWPPQSGLGVDGHPADGHFLPPMPDRRRMFAGGRVELHQPLELGTPATRVSSLHEVVSKQGRSGELVFVTVRHEISQGSRLCIVEQTDAVYRSGQHPRRAAEDVDTETTPVFDAPWQRGLRSDPVLLFRFSALTGNAHRIHYDMPYSGEVEGYPALVVHGPLLALLMLELFRGESAAGAVQSASFRFHRPVYAGEHAVAHGHPDGDGRGIVRIGTAREPEHATAEVVLG